LSAVNEIICFNYGGKGHKASTCPEKGKGRAKGGFQKGGAKQKDKRKCYYCGKIGHIAPNYFEDEKDASKRLANWELVNACGETVASAIDSGNRVEYLLCGMCFLTNAKLLNNPNVWIVDTAATVHSTPHKVGLTEPKKASATNLVRMGNGADVGAKMIAKLPGVV
jgi:hypothetical protein